YALTDGSSTNTQSIAFDTGGTTYTLTDTGAGTTESGGFTATRNGDIWDITTTDGATGTNATLSLNFASSTAGSYTYQKAGDASKQGTFAQSNIENPNPNPGGTNNPPGGTNNPPPNPGTGTVPAPATLSQITITTGEGSGVGAGSV